MDWLQLLGHGAGKCETETQELAMIMHGIRELAAELTAALIGAPRRDTWRYGGTLSLVATRGTGLIAMRAHTGLSSGSWGAPGRTVPLSSYPGRAATVRVERRRLGQGNRQAGQACRFDVPWTHVVRLDARSGPHAQAGRARR